MHPRWCERFSQGGSQSPLSIAETRDQAMRKKFPREVLHSKAEWKKVNINMHGELEPPLLELSYLKGATHSAKSFELPDNLRSVSSQEIKEFIGNHKITKIMQSDQQFGTAKWATFQSQQQMHYYCQSSI